MLHIDSVRRALARIFADHLRLVGVKQDRLLVVRILRHHDLLLRILSLEAHEKAGVHLLRSLL